MIDYKNIQKKINTINLITDYQKFKINEQNTFASMQID